MLWSDKVPWDLVYVSAKMHNLNPRMIAAIIQKESACDPWAIRYEPNWKYECNTELMAHIQSTTRETQVQLQKFSYGLMQVMGTVAYELGLRENPMKLCAYPQVGVLFGCKKLQQLGTRYKNDSDIISAYNMGSVLKDMNGQRLNQKSYVDIVLTFMEDLKKLGK